MSQYEGGGYVSGEPVEHKLFRYSRVQSSAFPLACTSYVTPMQSIKSRTTAIPPHSQSSERSHNRRQTGGGERHIPVLLLVQEGGGATRHGGELRPSAGGELETRPQVLQTVPSPPPEVEFAALGVHLSGGRLYAPLNRIDVGPFVDPLHEHLSLRRQCIRS